MKAKITLIGGEKAQLGVLTDEPPARNRREPLVLLEDHPETMFRPHELPPDHLIMVHESKQDAWDLVRVATEVGFNVRWEGELGK